MWIPMELLKRDDGQAEENSSLFAVQGSSNRVEGRKRASSDRIRKLKQHSTIRSLAFSNFPVRVFEVKTRTSFSCAKKLLYHCCTRCTFPLLIRNANHPCIYPPNLISSNGTLPLDLFADQYASIVSIACLSSM